jgi:hypothetical protein
LTTLAMLMAFACGLFARWRPGLPAVDGLLGSFDAEPDMMESASGLPEVESRTWNSRLGTSGKRDAIAIACEQLRD